MEYIGLDIGGTKILGALFKEDGTIITKVKKRSKANEGKDVVFSQITKVINELIESSKGKINGIGIGLPGIIDSEKGKVIFSPNLPWKNYNIKEELEKKYKINVNIGNDVNVGILGEWIYGAAKNKQNIIGIFVGTGIGGGLIINGKLYEGHTGAAGEIGHICVVPDGPYCGCGAKGCLEALASKTAIMQDIQSQIKRGRKTIFKEIFEKNDDILRSDELKQAINEKDELAIEILDKMGRYLGIAIASLINVLNPEIIVLGGGIIESIGDNLIPIITSYTKSYSMKKLMENTEIKAAALGDDSGIYGALQLAKEG
ncbi:MAG: ROK family protein [Fusobacteria bacterium]|nr:ROK family protein [Fusobacteriota bacterium]